MNTIKVLDYTAMSDSERLTAILSLYTSVRDPAAMSGILLNRIGSFHGVLEADPAMISSILPPRAATQVCSLIPLLRGYEFSKLSSHRFIGDRKQLTHYCRSLLLGKQVEELWVIAVDARSRLIGSRRITESSSSEISVSFRSVFKIALDLGAYGIFLCHNHPSGSLLPSQNDISATRELMVIMQWVGIALLDHLILADDKTYSMAAHGDLKYDK